MSCSLCAVRCLLFAVRRSLFVACLVSFVPFSLFDFCRLSSAVVVGCSVFVVRCLLSVVCSLLLFVVRCLLIVVCWLFLIVCCLFCSFVRLVIVRCVLFVG